MRKHFMVSGVYLKTRLYFYDLDPALNTTVGLL